MIKANLSHRRILQAILADESVFDTASDDGVCPDQDMASFFLDRPDYIVLLPSMDSAIIFRRQNRVFCEMHAAFVAGASRKKLREYSVAAIKWLFENTETEKIFSMIPAYHEPSIMYAKVGGMIEQCRLKNAIMKHGKLQDLVVLDMDKERFYSLHGGE